MSELQDYVNDKSGSWAVGDEHLTLLASFLANKDNCFPPNVPLLTLQILRGKYQYRIHVLHINHHYVIRI